jgi:hypothetical protein
MKNEISTMAVYDANIKAFQYLSTLMALGGKGKNANL